jgi:membrane associated rhomboid family serine protease
MFQFPPLPPVLPRHRRVIFALTAFMAVIEAAFQLSDMGIITQGLRWDAYREFSFVAPWFQDMITGREAPTQTAWNMLSYAFLHGSMTHFLMNGGAFLGLGLVTLRIFGAPLFALFFVVTAVGGALAFGLMSSSDMPMVGVSGVVFGLIGVLKYAELAFIRHQPGAGRRRWAMQKYLSSLAILAGVNIVISWMLADIMAWETHLGGFIAGWIVAWWVVPRAARDPATR